MDQSPFSKEFQKLASGTHKSYKELAQEMELSPALLARVISGSRPPSQQFVARCIKAFDLNRSQSDRLRHLAAISQEKITIVPRNLEEAEKIVAFIKDMRSQDVLEQADEHTKTP